jgi:hypothetical protein
MRVGHEVQEVLRPENERQLISGQAQRWRGRGTFFRIWDQHLPAAHRTREELGHGPVVCVDVHRMLRESRVRGLAACRVAGSWRILVRPLLADRRRPETRAERPVPTRLPTCETGAQPITPQ